MQLGMVEVELVQLSVTLATGCVGGPKDDASDWQAQAWSGRIVPRGVGVLEFVRSGFRAVQNLEFVLDNVASLCCQAPGQGRAKAKGWVRPFGPAVKLRIETKPKECPCEGSPKYDISQCGKNKLSYNYTQVGEGQYVYRR